MEALQFNFIMRILVTGGAGNIGGSLCRELVKDKNIHVDIIDNLSTGSADKLPKSELDNWKFYNFCLWSQ